MSSSITMSPEKENFDEPCKVCEKPGIALHYGVWTCGSCKSFFGRFVKTETESLICRKDSNCDLSASQSHKICTYCRFQKCLEVGMKCKSYRRLLDDSMSPEKECVPKPCKVCEKPGIALHYGVWTCEACKSFFMRSLKRGTESLFCAKDSGCDLFNSLPHEICKLCRFQKCVKVGMKIKADRLNDSSIMPSEKEKVSRPCKICENPGCAINYGLWICEACRSFFARYLKRGTESLFCKYDSNCDLSSRQPYAICKYCRFQKCVKLGSISETYRDRLVGQAQRAFTSNNQLPSPSSSLQSSELMEIDNEPEPLSELQEINNIVELYKEGCSFTADKINGFELKEFEMVIIQNNEPVRAKAWMDYAEEIEADIRALLPFFDELQDSFNSNDKAILLKRSAFQIYLLRRIRALNPYGLLLSDGRVIRMASLQFLYGIPLIDGMLQVRDRILQLGCTDEDIAMFITMVYYKPGKLEDLGSLNLQNPDNLAPTQQKFKNLFVKHAETRGVDQRVFQNLIELCPELERLKAMHQERLEFLKPYRFAFPEDSLFVEVYDIDPKIVTVQNEPNLPSNSPVNNESH